MTCWGAQYEIIAMNLVNAGLTLNDYNGNTANMDMYAQSVQAIEALSGGKVTCKYANSMFTVTWSKEGHDDFVQTGETREKPVRAMRKFFDMGQVPPTVADTAAAVAKNAGIEGKQVEELDDEDRTTDASDLAKASTE